MNKLINKSLSEGGETRTISVELLYKNSHFGSNPDNLSYRKWQTNEVLSFSCVDKCDLLKDYDLDLLLILFNN